jgi:two-component system response regulator HydG
VVHFDVRIIVASNKPMEEAVSEGTFRADLFYRLNEFNIKLPPLRERKEDITIIASNLLKEANSDLNKSVKGFRAEALAKMIQYDWPGNVRELRNVIRKSALMEESNELRNIIIPFAKISMNGFGHGNGNGATNGAYKIEGLEGHSLEDATDILEKELILKAIDKAGGNKQKAAKTLGINRKTLYRKMKKLEIAL